VWGVDGVWTVLDIVPTWWRTARFSSTADGVGRCRWRDCRPTRAAGDVAGLAPSLTWKLIVRSPDGAPAL